MPGGARQVALDWRAGATHVHGYAMRLTQALDNLVANAVEHGRGPVTVTGRMSGSHVSVCVLDRGAGLMRPSLRRPPALLAGAPRSWPGRRTPRRRVARRHPASGPGSVRLGDRGPAAGAGPVRLRCARPARLLFPAGPAPAPPPRDAAPPRGRRCSARRRSAPAWRCRRWTATRARSSLRSGRSSRSSWRHGTFPAEASSLRRSHPRRWPSGRCHSGSRRRGALSARAEAVGLEAASGLAAGDYVGESQLRPAAESAGSAGSLVGRRATGRGRGGRRADDRRRCCVRGRWWTC